ncbi:MAG: hypothetical protein ACTSSI_17455, partial [Candidatus Helarchaeota archaeon]
MMREKNARKAGLLLFITFSITFIILVPLLSFLTAGLGSSPFILENPITNPELSVLDTNVPDSPGSGDLLEAERYITGTQTATNIGNPTVLSWNLPKNSQGTQFQATISDIT